MSMLDALFKGAFKGSKCKTLLKLTIPRIKLLRNRREIQIKQMRKDIAKLLETGQEATARIRVEHIIREENMMSAQEIIELFCELIVVRLPIIEIQRECPLDLKEAISSVCFAAPRCADLPELQQLQMLFISKYGKEFVAAAAELMPDCGVNRQLIELLSIRAPSPEVKLKLLKEIAEEYEVDWDPAASETEFLKPHEDLLNGPSQFVSGSKLPLPKEKHDISLPSSPVQASHEKSDSDTGFFDELDFPEIPKVAPRRTFNTKSAPQMCFLPLPDTLDFGDDDQVRKYSEENENPRKSPQLEPEKVMPSSVSQYESVNSSVSSGENKQFLPFISPPSFSSKEYKPSSSISRTKSEVHVDLQDVLAAAHAAAESAEQAAAAARSAASLAQVRITELIKKRDDPSSKNGVPTFHKDGTDGTFSDPLPDPGPNRGSETLNLPSYDTHKVGDEPQISDDQVPDHGSTHRRPERLTSIEDDPYFSYPNLFSRQNSNLASDIHSPADISASTREN